MDLAVSHAKGDEAAAQVTTAEEETQAPEPGFGTVAAVALHLRLYRLAAVGTIHDDRALIESRHHNWGRRPPLGLLDQRGRSNDVHDHAVVKL